LTAKHSPIQLSSRRIAQAPIIVKIQDIPHRLARTIAAPLGTMALCFAMATPAIAAEATGAPASHGKGEVGWDLFQTYCIECHNAEDWAGGVAFDTMQPSDIPQNVEVLEKVVRKMRSQQMPPGGKKVPDKETRAAFVAWMEGNLDEAGKAHPDPGRVGLHRLNRKEYANAVRDLLGIEIDPADVLPRDEPREGFDNIAAALQVTPSFLDQYIAAARIVAVQALGNKDALPAGTTYRAQKPGTQLFHQDGLPLGTRGGIAVDHNFPADGEYVLNIANMAQALWVYNMEFENHLVVTLNGELIYETTIGGEDDMKAIDQKQDPAVDAINKRLKNIRFNAKAGVHRFVVAFRQRTFAESEDRLQMYVPGGGQDRVLRVNSFEIRGPFNPTGVSMTEARKHIFTCYPKDAAEERPCAEEVVGRVARRAFRRPLTTGDLEGLMAFYEAGRKESDFDAGVRRSITAVLAHPDFLYRADSPPEGDLAPGTIYTLSDLDLATRLSFFLWSSLPDDQLLDVATSGRLRDPQVLEAQVRRMLADDRARTLATNFGTQWLNLPKLSEITPDPAIFPYASGPGDLRLDFTTEASLFMDSIFRGDESVLRLLDSPYTFVNERLALHYGINSVRGDQFRKVKLDDASRHGLLGKGAVLMVSSYPNRTSPVLRGAFVLERIMGAPPPIPPPAVEALPAVNADKKPDTVRALLEMHRQKPQCFSCHASIDPIGFVLEGFDATGKARSMDRFARTEIDMLGQLPDGTIVRNPQELRAALLADPVPFVQNVTERLIMYALGRVIEPHDMPFVREIVRSSAADEYRFSTLILNIVKSDDFQKATVPLAGDGPVIKQAAAAH
jgi:mono/diheme cytochrome c family protein